MVGLKATQRLFEHLQGERTVAAMSADLGHDEGFVAPAFQAQAQPGLGFAAIVLPGIVVKGDASVEGAVDNFNGGFLIFRATKMMTAETERGDLDACLAKLSMRDGHVPPS